jgi:hypothetical protein
MCCRIESRSGDLISAFDEGACDNRGSAARRTGIENQKIGGTALMRLKREAATQMSRKSI